MIFCGHPYNLAIKLDFPINNYLKSLTIPTVFIQNEFDPVGSFTELEKILLQNSPADYQLIKNPGNNTHDYEDFENLVSIAKQFFETN